MAESSKALIAVKWLPLDGGGATLSLAEPSKDAREKVLAIVCAAEDITTVATQAELEEANATISSIARYVREVESEHETRKKPFLLAGRAIDTAKNKALEEVLPIQKRLKDATHDYLTELAKKQAEDERKRQAEVARIQREQIEQAADAARQKTAAEAAERQRLVEWARLVEEKSAAETARLERERQEAEIAKRVAWDNSELGKAEAAAKRAELERQRAEAEARAKAIAAEQVRVQDARATALAAEKLRQEEAALQAAVVNQKIESVTASAPVEVIPTRWAFRLVGLTPRDQAVAMAKICVVRPDLFNITPRAREVAALAKEIGTSAHGFDCFEFFEEIIQRTSRQ